METSLLPGDGLREDAGGEEDLRRSGMGCGENRSRDPDMSCLPQMSDRGGGVPLRKIERLFSYMYSTAPMPQPGTGGTPLVSWLHSSSPRPPEECASVFLSLIKLSLVPITCFPTSLGTSMGGCRLCVMSVPSSESGLPCSSSLSPACTSLPICGCLSVPFPQFSLSSLSLH